MQPVPVLNVLYSPCCPWISWACCHQHYIIFPHVEVIHMFSSECKDKKNVAFAYKRIIALKILTHGYATKYMNFEVIMMNNLLTNDNYMTTFITSRLLMERPNNVYNLSCINLMFISCFMYSFSSADKHLGYFLSLPIMNNATRTIHCVSFWMDICSVLLLICLK